MRLKPEQRAVVVLHFYLGLPVPEVAETLGIPLGTAKSRLHYAIEALRAALEADARFQIAIEWKDSMTREPDEDQVREWLHEEASGQLPDWVLNATFERTRRNVNGGTVGVEVPHDTRPSTTRDHAALRSPWVLIPATILALALMGGALVIGARLLPTTPPDLGPLAVRDAADRLSSGYAAQEWRHRDRRRHRDGGATWRRWPRDGPLSRSRRGSSRSMPRGDLRQPTDSPSDGSGLTARSPRSPGRRRSPCSVSRLGSGEDKVGNLYVVDVGRRILKVDPSGDIAAYAGLAYSGGPCGDVEPAMDGATEADWALSRRW